MKKIILIVGIIIIVIVAGFIALGQFYRVASPQVLSFKECVAAGNPVMESYPRQCSHNGQTYTEEIDREILPFDSGVQGQVLLGPTCPVERIPPDPACADRPYQTTVQVILVGSPKSSTFATVEADKEGNYKILLPPGDYAIQPVGKSPFPFCGTENITVKPSEIQELNLSCDTGIR